MAEKTQGGIELETKCIQLGRAMEKSDMVLATGRESAIKRHAETMRDIIKDMSKLIQTVEAEKITAIDDGEGIDAWLTEMEEELDQGDERINILEQWLTDSREKSEQSEHQKTVDLEIELYQAKLKLQAEHLKPETKQVELEPNDNNTVKPAKLKLPDLKITPFYGTYGYWTRFWGQFSVNIDKSNIPPMNKFGYLREYLCEKAKKSIKALPYTAEGYNRALAILKDMFGKQSGIMKTY
jgi:hypothetical protein